MPRILRWLLPVALMLSVGWALAQALPAGQVTGGGERSTAGAYQLTGAVAGEAFPAGGTMTNGAVTLRTGFYGAATASSPENAAHPIWLNIDGPNP